MMLTTLIDLCLRYRPVVLLCSLAVAVGGFASLRRLPFDAFPDTTPVQVQVNTVAPALAPLEIERQVTFPLEQAISGLPGLRDVRSVSKFGFSQLTAVFSDATDIYRARQVVSERLASAELPRGIDRPSLGPISTGLGEVFQYILESEELTPEELRTLHHWVVRPQMLQVPGVAEVNSWGGRKKQYHVVVDPVRLIQHGLSLDDVARVLATDNRNVGAGVLDQAGESLLVQGQGLAHGLSDLEQIVVASRSGTPIHLRDVAHIHIGHQLRRGAVSYQGRGEAVLGLGFMLMGTNSRALSQRLEQQLVRVRESLPASVEITPVYRRSSLVTQVLQTVRDNLLEGALLVVAVLFAFLGSLRSGLIVALAIPLSMLFAFSAMLQFGIAGSLMSLGAIDFGLVVDSSLIMVENATRRVANERSSRTIREVVRDAAIEVRGPTLFGELIIAIVYLPILSLEGVEGKLFRPMALTVIFALAASMLISVTLMPVLASYSLRRTRQRPENLLVRGLKAAYRPLLDWALGHRKLVLSATCAVLACAAALAPRLGAEFVPRLREQAIVINTVRMAGVALDESVRYGGQIERRLLAAYPDEIAHIWTRTGTAEVATDPMGLEVSDVFITLQPRSAWTKAATQDQLVEAMRANLDGLPGMRSIFTQPIEMRVNEMLAGIRSDVGIKIYGDDFDILEEKAQEVRAALSGIPGATDVSVEQLSGQSLVTIEIDRRAAGRHHIPVGELLDFIESLGNRRVGEIVEGQRRFDLVLKLGDGDPRSIASLGQLVVPSRSGRQVRLAAVARIEIKHSPASIQREWAQRRITVQANIRGRDIGSFVAELRRTLGQNVDLPEGYHLKIGGQFEQLERGQQRLMWAVPIAIVLVFTLLYIAYGRMADALRVFTGVPLAAVGGIFALWLCDMPFSISAGVGFIALSGVAVLGDMVLVARVMALRKRGHAIDQAIRGAAESRLRPVLMTAMVAAVGFLPMAFNTGVGAEVQRPLATVVIGGLLSSTMATLLLLPVLYAMLGPAASGESQR